MVTNEHIRTLNHIRRMKLCDKEIEAIKESESYHDRKLGFLKRLLFQKFKFNKNEVPKNKTMLELWKIYGLRNKENFSFTKDEQLNCMAEWFKILHSNGFNYINAYEQSATFNIQTVGKKLKTELNE